MWEPPLPRIRRTERWSEFFIAFPVPTKAPKSSFVTFLPAHSYIHIRSIMQGHSQTASGLMGNPCGSRLLMRRPLPSGRLGSPRMARPRKSRSFLPRMVLRASARDMLDSHADWPSFPSRILVWDAQNSRYLLECTSAEFHPDVLW